MEVRPNGDFSSPLGKSKLLSVMINRCRAARPVRANDIQPPLAGMADEATQREVLMLLSNIIDIQSVECVRSNLYSCCGLLRYPIVFKLILFPVAIAQIGCAGAIIGYLSRNGIAHRNTHDGRSLTMFNIASFSM